MTETATSPLTGKALLARVKELSSLPRRERAKQCGYFTVTKNNQVRVNLTDFYDALLSARGVPLSPETPKDGSKIHTLPLHSIRMIQHNRANIPRV